MNGFMKVMLMTLMIVYVVSPVDFVPGPVDDLILILAGIAAQTRIGRTD